MDDNIKLEDNPENKDEDKLLDKLPSKLPGKLPGKLPDKLVDDFYILTINNSLSTPICREIIQRFENQSNKREGQTAQGINKSIKVTYDFHLSEDAENWKDIDKVLFNELNKALLNYFQKINKDIVILNNLDFSDKGFQIQKYYKNQGFYVFHNDFSIYNENENKFRILTYIWYLNSIEEGGETDFYNKGIIKPEEGKLVLFPACWTYPHAGRMPVSSNKYVITGWVTISYI
jgi:hypothetical protein